MPDKKRFDPRKFIDRDFEQELFENLLQFKSQARILAIRDGGGKGKSQLLEKFQYRCRTVKPRTPVSLIVLDQLPDNNRLTLVKYIFQDLAAFGLEFPNFNQYDLARASGNFTAILSSIYLQEADFRGAYDTKIATAMANVAHAEHVTVKAGGVSSLTPDQQVIADDVCVRAFFDDLKNISSEQPVVLMMDAYEKCEAELKRWIEDDLLHRFFFDFEKRPEKLVLVLAGREIPDFEFYWPREDCEATVTSVNGLGQWTKAHVKECLDAHGYSYTEDDLELFWKLVQKGTPPSTVILAMEGALQKR